MADHRVKILKKERYICRPCQGTKKLWNVTVIPVVDGALGIIPKGSVKRLGNLEIRR